MKNYKFMNFKINFQLFSDDVESCFDTLGDTESHSNESYSMELEEEIQDEHLKDNELTQTKSFSSALKRARERDQMEIENLRNELEEARVSPYRGQVNPYNGVVIETKDDAYTYQKMHEEALAEKTKISDDYIYDMIENHPAVVEARALKERQHEIQAKLYGDSQIAEINKLDPSIKSADDLLNIKNIEQFDDLVLNRGFDLVSAFKLANFDVLANNRSKIARRSVLKNSSKDHLIRTGGVPGNAVDIPVDILKSYKDFGFSDKEAISDYKKINTQGVK